MKAIPNEGMIDLPAIRIREYGEHFSGREDPSQEHWELDYDVSLRFTQVRPLDELEFAFKKNVKL
ncbi:hypothetical protein HON22_04030 [Candidatus Peregrinibacteria bacterium]|jgi:hypothetical protein|nr:hypothetical protein [Candidatus Peregrinibacteria bacterium]